MQSSLTFPEINGQKPLPSVPYIPEPPRSNNSSVQDTRKLVEALKQSRFYQEYGEAFTKMTGLSLVLIPAAPAPSASPGEARLSREARDHSSRAAPWEVEGESPAVNSPSDPCFTIVPVIVKGRVIGYLRSGLMFVHEPTAKQFEDFLRQAGALGGADRESLKNAYFSAAVLTEKTHESAVRLLSFLAQHLGMLSIQVFISPQVAEPSYINQARAYIQEHQSEKIYLAHVANLVNLNTFYFCKIFKRVTGLNFTEYVARVRIERSKTLLANPELAVADVARASGFQTITHFNRVFKKLTGFSPTAFRNQILCG